MTDPQNAHNPDKTQPLNAMPAAAAVPSPAPAPDKTPKAPAAQMELLNTPPPATPAAEKHSLDKTQPVHVIPASAAPHESAKASSPPVTPPRIEAAKAPPAPAHQEGVKTSAPSVTTPMWPIEAAKPSPASTTPTHQETARVAATSGAKPLWPIEPPKTTQAAATPAQQDAAITPPTSTAPMHQEAAKTSAPHVAAPPRNEATKTPPASTTSAPPETVKPSPPPVSTPPRIDTAKTASPAHQENAKSSAPPVATPVTPRAEATKAAPVAPERTSTAPHSEKAPPAAAPAQGEYVKTVTMAAATPAASPDVVLSRSTKPLTPIRDRLRWLAHRIATTAFVKEILPGAGAKLQAYGALTRLNKPIGIWLLLWPVLWALWISSGGRPDPHVFIVFVIGTVLTRSAGCAINDFADRNFDGHVKRTKDRPLVTGAVDPMEAIAICLGLGLIALGLALTLNLLAQKLTLIGGVLVLTYPFFKRFFPLPQAYLGIAFTWSVPMAFAAQSGEVSRIAVVMFLAGVAWTVAYDTMYAMVDREDDKKLGIRSSAILFGDADRFIIGIMQLMTVLGLWLIGHEMELGLWYGLGLAFAAMFALYQQLLIRERKPEKCFRAFLNNNYFGMSVFIGILLEYTFR